MMKLNTTRLRSFRNQFLLYITAAFSFLFFNWFCIQRNACWMAFVLVVHFWALTVGFLCRYQSLESTIPNAGLRRTCWRSKERGREPTTRKKAWWVLFLNWMLKVMVSFKMRFQLQHCHFLLCLALNLLLLSSIILVCADVDALLKKSESQHEPPEDGCPFGPLTQRLLQALVEVSDSRCAKIST